MIGIQTLKIQVLQGAGPINQDEGHLIMKKLLALWVCVGMTGAELAQAPAASAVAASAAAPAASAATAHASEAKARNAERKAEKKAERKEKQAAAHDKKDAHK